MIPSVSEVLSEDGGGTEFHGIEEDGTIIGDVRAGSYKLEKMQSI